MRIEMNSSYHATRLRYDSRREVLWKTLYDAYFSKWIQPQYHVLELGAGYGDFINSVRCARRSALPCSLRSTSANC